MVLSNNQKRKLEHLEVVLKENVEGPLTTLFEYVFMHHYAASEVALQEVNLRTKFLGKYLDAPIMITGMTGGAPGTEKINMKLAEVAEEYNIALGVGSQRAALENKSLEYTFKVVREKAPTIPIVANIGASEVVKYDVKVIERAISMVDADALAIHLNLPQEYVQPEGKALIKGFKDKLVEVKDSLNIPIIIKEVGFGLSYFVVKDLRNVGIQYFDISGSGGTNWVLVEMFRARKVGNALKEGIALNLAEWGIPTAIAIIEARNAAPDAFIIGSGGIRSALDALKALRLGADMVGFARPVLKALMEGKLREFLRAFIESLKALVALTNSRDVHELRRKPVIVTGILKDWIESMNLRIP